MPGCASESQFGSGSSGVSKAGGPRVGAIRGSLAGSPRWVRMRWTRLVAVTKAIRRSAAPYRGADQRESTRLRGALVGRNEPGPAQAPERAGSPDRAAWSGTGHLAGQPSHRNRTRRTQGQTSQGHSPREGSAAPGRGRKPNQALEGAREGGLRFIADIQGDRGGIMEQMHIDIFQWLMRGYPVLPSPRSRVPTRTLPDPRIRPARGTARYHITARNSLIG